MSTRLPTTSTLARPSLFISCATDRLWVSHMKCTQEVTRGKAQKEVFSFAVARTHPDMRVNVSETRGGTGERQAYSFGPMQPRLQPLNPGQAPAWFVASTVALNEEGDK